MENEPHYMQIGFNHLEQMTQEVAGKCIFEFPLDVSYNVETTKKLNGLSNVSVSSGFEKPGFPMSTQNPNTIKSIFPFLY